MLTALHVQFVYITKTSFCIYMYLFLLATCLYFKYFICFCVSLIEIISFIPPPFLICHKYRSKETQLGVITGNLLNQIRADQSGDVLLQRSYMDIIVFLNGSRQIIVPNQFSFILPDFGDSNLIGWVMVTWAWPLIR